MEPRRRMLNVVQVVQQRCVLRRLLELHVRLHPREAALRPCLDPRRRMPALPQQELGQPVPPR